MARINEMTDLATIAEVLEVENAFNQNGRPLTFAITGHLGRPRKDIINIIEQAGGRFEKTSRWGVNYLITNNDWTQGSVKGSKSNKLRKAEELGIKIIGEQQFYDMLMEGSTAADGWGN